MVELCGLYVLDTFFTIFCKHMQSSEKALNYLLHSVATLCETCTAASCLWYCFDIVDAAARRFRKFTGRRL